MLKNTDTIPPEELEKHRNPPETEDEPDDELEFHEVDDE